MGRRKNSLVKCLEQINTINYEPQPLHDTCPTLDKVINSNEMHLFDLSSLQLELERLLTSVIERLACLSAESKGHELPPEMMKALQLLTSNNNSCIDPDANHSASGHPSLIVKANPDKPLTLIISQRGRSQQQSVLSSLDASIGNRPKTMHSIPFARRTSRSSVDENADHSPSSSSPDKNQSINYAIPNKFWELMEPYCADITEANIAYLESLIRSYQDMEASYFQLPPLCTPDSMKSETTESIAAKRPKREALHNSAVCPIPTTHTSSDSTTAVSVTDAIPGFASASNVVHLARCLEKELKAPCSESSTLGKLSQSLLNSCYQENIMFAFTEGIERLSGDRDSHLLQDNAEKNRPTDYTTATTPTTTDWRSSTPDESSDTNMTEDGEANEIASAPNIPDGPCRPYEHSIQSNRLLLPPSLRQVVTARASQPLKSLAKQMRVSSSYRVEKKIAQAIDELGLFPLNLIHSPSVKPITTQALTKPEHCCALTLTTTTTTTTTTNHNNSHDADSRLDQAPIARLKIKASSLKSPLAGHELVASGPTSPASPTAKRRRRSAGPNQKPCSPQNNADNTSRLPNGTHWTDAETNKPCRTGTVKPEQDDSHYIHPVNGSTIRTRNSGGRRESKQLRSNGYRGRLRNSLHPIGPADSAQQHANGCNGSSGSDCRNSSTPVSPKGVLEPRLVNGSSDPHSDILGDAEDDNDHVTSDQACKSHKHGSQVLSSPSSHPNQQHCPWSSRSHHHQPCGDEHPEQCGKSADSQLMVNGEVFTFDHEDATANSLDEKRVQDGRIVNEMPSDIGVDICSVRSPTRDQADADSGPICTSKSTDWVDAGDCDTIAPRDRLFRLSIEHKFESDLSFLLNEFALDADRLAKGILPSCGDSNSIGGGSTLTTAGTRGPAVDEVAWAILQRQHELRMVCAANHSVLRRLVQAARRDVQRQEIQRRLAIADADVIEAYNKLESYRPLRKPPLKRDRDMAYKALKERRKILKELEAFDTCSP